MTKILEKSILGVLVLLVLASGTVFVSAISTNTSPTDWVSSIRISDNNDDTIQSVSEAQESVQLAPLAKITQDEAIMAALSATPGNFIAAELENEDGNIVYSVEMDNAGVVFEVKVDAGTGKVLKVNNDSDEYDMKVNDDFETDGIDHEFEGDEGDHED